ncbi:polysaccharide deacetylase family protein [Marinobacter lipolyticus]|uniref:polysaccharide deacetylase family protein n=1 Tax=Marinobacter lipolyticus TaxID=209639 RepID=UPI003A8DF7F5
MDSKAKTIGYAQGGTELAYLRTGLKFIALTMFALIGWVKVRFASRPTLIILTYHRILPTDHPDRKHEQPGMVTAPEVLQAHIRQMKSLGAAPLHLNEWLEKRAGNELLPDLSFALTFDDGWRDNYQYAYPVLTAENTPATIFLVTQLLDTNQTFWPEQVLTLLTTRAIPDSVPYFQWLIPFLPNQKATEKPLTLKDADEVISRLKALDDQSILNHLRAIPGQGHLPEDTANIRSILNTPELVKMATNGLIRYGGHTQHHYRLNRISDASQLKREIVDCLGDLKKLDKGVVPIFCYPNGNITKDGERLVAEHYEAACTTRTGWNKVNQDPFDLHRFNLHDGNSYSFRTLLATIGRGIL